MAEGARLESVFRVKPNVGSNPTLSATESGPSTKETEINRTGRRRNGIPAFSSTADVQTQQGQVRVTVYAYEFATNQAFHFTAINPVNTSPFDTMFKSVSRITQAEAAAVKPRKLQVVKVAKNDTVATLAAKMAYKSLQTERFRALNGLSGTATVKVGQKVKIVTY